MNARRTMIGRRGRALAGLAVAAVVSVSTGGGVASAATSSTLLYSTDGGATWTSNATVAAGGTVLVRQWYDNDGSAAETSASLATQLPDGFTLNGGSTQVCLNPSTTNPTSPNSTELVCASSNEGAVWSGSDLQVSPTAGLFGQSNGLTSGILEMGKRRYLNMQECRYVRADEWQFSRVINVEGPAWNSTSNASNGIGASGSCGAGNVSSPLYSERLQTFDLLGNRYLNLQECRYRDASLGWDFVRMINVEGPLWSSKSNASNTTGASGSCGAGNATAPLHSEHLQTFDLLGNRYLNLQECRFRNPVTTWEVVRVINVEGPLWNSTSNASNSIGTGGSCGAGNAAAPLHSERLQTFDLLDTGRGRGYVQYSVTAPPAPTPEACASNPTATSELFDQDSSLTSTPSGAQAASGTITVDWSALDEPCPVDPIPLGDPLVLAGGLGALAGAAYLLHRRRMAIAA